MFLSDVGGLKTSRSKVDQVVVVSECAEMILIDPKSASFFNTIETCVELMHKIQTYFSLVMEV